jgi:putative ABC transport system ATP-binding protein
VRVPLPAGGPAPAGSPATGWQVVRRAVGRQRGRVAAFVSLLTVWQLCEAMVPVLIGVAIERGVASGEVGTFVAWAAALVGLFVALSYSYRFGSRIGMRAIETEVHRLRMEIAEHALDPRGVRADRLTGETLSLATSDAEEVGHALRMIGYAVASLAAVIVAAVVLLRIDLALGLVVLAGVPLCLAATQAVTPVVSRRSRVQQERAARSAGVATDLVRGIRVLHGIGGEPAAADRYRAASREACGAGIHAAGARAVMFGLAQTLSGLLLAVVTLLAGRLALDGRISVGELIAIVGLTQFLAEPITVLAEMGAQTAAAVASSGRIAGFLALPHLASSGPERLDGRSDGGAALALSGVRHGTLDGLELGSPTGELLGLVVADPSDAQALVRLLAAEAPAEDLRGDVRLGAASLSELHVDARRARLAVAPHRVDLFEGTLRGNIDPWGSLDDEGLARVLAASAADEVVGLRPGGLDEAVTPDGSTYSGGQRQRIALARALAAGTPVLVLHDPTTAVDSVTEQRIARGIRDLRGDGSLTTWLITSSPALLEQTDRVVLVRGGRVVAEGTHRALLRDPDYQATVLR